MSMILHYWNGRGLAEPCRLMFTLSDKDIHLEDIRYSRARMPKDPIKPFKEICSNLEHNLGRLPVLCTNNQTIGQSIAINYYTCTVHLVSISLKIFYFKYNLYMQCDMYYLLQSMKNDYVLIAIKNVCTICNMLISM